MPSGFLQVGGRKKREFLKENFSCQKRRNEKYNSLIGYCPKIVNAISRAGFFSHLNKIPRRE